MSPIFQKARRRSERLPVKWSLKLLKQWTLRLICLSTINVVGQFGKEYDVDLSVSDVKMLLHNAVMVERIFSTFGKSPNLMKNLTTYDEY